MLLTKDLTQVLRMNRIKELEDKAIELYLNEIEWHLIIEMLSKEEQEEYWELIDNE